ncbi:hypothetical protein MMC30_006185 [Trapelia coarctata]|nr:hypothetical protein [Trapelia coarctata]
MPADYQHHRVRLRIEQTRLLNWGEKVGLMKELLDQPSHVLQLNRNLIIDILLEVQAVFKDCVSTDAKYEKLVPIKSFPSMESEKTFERRFPQGPKAILSKTLSFLEKAPQVPQRLKWVMVDREKFDGLITKLIGYNDAIESLLDRNSIDDLKGMQHQMYMAMLQLNVRVAELKEISLAMRITPQPPTSTPLTTSLPPDPTILLSRLLQNQSFAHLAEFKAHQTSLETLPQSASLPPIPRHQISLSPSPSSAPRSAGTYQNTPVWIEWKYYDQDQNPHSDWNRTILLRVQKLAILLGARAKPAEFRAPQCLGYFDDSGHAPHRYGFLYEKPAAVPPDTTPLSLLDRITTTAKPSLTKRVKLAHAIARCLMYLHSVNWLHKGLRSNAIIFFTPPGHTPEYASPIISGFDYARPDLPDEVTEPLPEHSEHDIYRHPGIISRTLSRSKKSHDIYSLGVVFVEIAFWRRIDDLVGMPENVPRNVKAVRAKVRKVREILLGEDVLREVEGGCGETYRGVVERCLRGGRELGVEEGADETDAEVGAGIQAVFEEKVVGKLGGLRL